MKRNERLSGQEIDAMLESMSLKSKRVVKTLIDKHLVGNHLANVENSYAAGRLLVGVLKEEGAEACGKIAEYLSAVAGCGSVDKLLRLVEVWKLAEIRSHLKRAAAAKFPGLTVCHFFELSAVEPTQRQDWIDRTIEHRWSVRELRSELSSADAETAGKGSSKAGRKVSVPVNVAAAHDKGIKLFQYAARYTDAFAMMRKHRPVNPKGKANLLRGELALNRKQRDAEAALMQSLAEDIKRLEAREAELRAACKDDVVSSMAGCVRKHSASAGAA